MFLDFLHARATNSLSDISIQHSTDEHFYFLSHVPWELESGISDIVKHFVHILIVVGRFAHHHFV